MIPVTKTFLPKKEEYDTFLNDIWKSGWITNNGKYVNSLEKKLQDYLGVKHCIFVSNGTIAIQIALKVLGISKEVITTPYSYVATTNALLWESCKPVFVDIDPKNFSIDYNLIEAAITENTEAILATHCYGFPGYLLEIEKIAKKYSLKIIYDAAHAFGVSLKGNSVLNYGNLSTLSFHATKLFHTVEGGAIICHDDELAEKIKLYRSFGHEGDKYFCLGINGKNSEFHAAMGHSVLPYMGDIIKRRKEIYHNYVERLFEFNQFNFSILDDFTYNYSYFPFLAKDEPELLKLILHLNEVDVFPRRYFFPSLNKLPHSTGEACPVSENISKRVICLPLYFGLEDEELELIISSIIEFYR